MSSWRRGVVPVVGLLVVTGVLGARTVRELTDDVTELADQVETRINGAVVQRWTVDHASCPDFAAAEAGASIDCTALASTDGTARRPTSVRVTIARCHSALPGLLTGQDDTRDCAYEYQYTVPAR